MALTGLWGRALVFIVAASASLVGVATAQEGGSAGATCAPASHPGGDWPVYGQNYHNTRRQDAESVIGPANAASLAVAWSFTPADAEIRVPELDEGGVPFVTTGFGRMESTPVVGEGCVYVSTSSGFVFALNADTGELVWGRRVATTTNGNCCGGTIFAGTVHGGTVYFGVGRAQREADPISGKTGTFLIALDSRTGETKWMTEELALEEGAYTNSSVVYYDGMVWLGISGPEVIAPPEDYADRTREVYEAAARGGFVLVDATDGSLILRTRTVPFDEWVVRGDAGGSIWSTAAIDDDGFGYAATGQPNPWEGSIQSDYTNAVVKFDLERVRNGAPNPDFGRIVGRMWGDPDVGRDVDWAGSPTLYVNAATGEQMIAGAQKSGNLHAGFTSTALPTGPAMRNAWLFPLSAVGSPLFNFCSVANDGTNVYGAGAVPGQLWSVNGTTGAPNWVRPVNTRNAAQPVAVANGVVYFPGQNGTLYAFDAATGDVLLEHDIAADTGADCENIGGGIAIARNTVYAMCGDRGDGSTGPTDAESGWLVAYRLPETQP